MATGVKELLKNWTARTAQLFKSNQTKYNIGKTSSLLNSIQGRTQQTQEDQLTASFQFLETGRFVDMGVGKGTKFAEASLNKRGSYTKGRVPKKWYSRTFYGRLNALQGAIGFSFMEQSISSIKEPLTMQAYESKRGRKF